MLIVQGLVYKALQIGMAILMQSMMIAVYVMVVMQIKIVMVIVLELLLRMIAENVLVVYLIM